MTSVELFVGGDVFEQADVSDSDSTAFEIPVEQLTPPITPCRSCTDLRLLDSEALQQLNSDLSTRSPQEILSWIANAGFGKVVQFTSFGFSGMVITDVISKMSLDIPIAFIDTLHHFQETLELKQRVESVYSRPVMSYTPQAANTREEFEQLYGSGLWESDADFYHYLTKMEPTQRALNELQVDVWITGRRRSQGAERSTLQVIEILDDGLIKCNPLAWMSWDDVMSYIKQHSVPYNSLLDQGYKSIGDYHSTSRVSHDHADGERAGRWKGRGRTECGMHSISRRKSSLNQQDPSQFDASNQDETTLSL